LLTFSLLLCILWLAGIAEASARGAGEAGLAAGAQDQGDEQPRLKVIEFQYGLKDISKIIRFYFVYNKSKTFRFFLVHSEFPKSAPERDLCAFLHIFQGLSSIVYDYRCVFLYIQFDLYDGKMFWIHISTCFETFGTYDQENKLHFQTFCSEYKSI